MAAPDPAVLFDRSRATISSAIQSTFVKGLQDRQAELSVSLKELMDQFFIDVRESLGVDKTPAKITAAGYVWADVKEKWQKQKKIETRNAFYVGKRGSRLESVPGQRRKQRLTFEHPGALRPELQGDLDANELYGEPEISFGSGGSGGIMGEGNTRVDAKGKIRYIRGAPSRKDASLPFDPRNKGRGGRFATLVQSLSAVMTVQMFPKVITHNDLYTGFSEKNAMKLQIGDEGTHNRVRRPFLTGFLRYYVRVKAEQIIKEFIHK